MMAKAARAVDKLVDAVAISLRKPEVSARWSPNPAAEQPGSLFQKAPDGTDDTHS